jgi:hypothetical protein
VVSSRLLVTAPAVIGQAEVGQRAGFADPVTVLTAEGEGLLKVASGLAETALCSLGSAEHRQCRRFGGPVAGLRGGAAGMTVHSGGIGEVADVQVTEDGGGQADGVAGPTVVGGVRGDRDQGRPLRV